MSLLTPSHLHGSTPAPRPTMPTTSTASGHISPSFFPGEILGEVFSHCDRTTLATVVSLVSFDCLALSARLLYEDVTVDTAQRLARLLRIPVNTATPSYFTLPKTDKVELTSHRVCFLQHPDTTPGFDPTHFTFDTNYPDGFPIPSRPSPNRVTPCSSLSLVHSITFSGSPNGSTASYLGDYYVPPDEDDEKDEGYCEPFAFLDSLAAFQPLELAVLVIDFPDAGSEEWFGPFMTLFDPVKFVLRARAGCRWTIFELRGKAQNWDMPWSRLTTVILSGVQLLDCHQLDIGERPIRVFVDLTWVKEDVAMQIHATRLRP